MVTHREEPCPPQGHHPLRPRFYDPDVPWTISYLPPTLTYRGRTEPHPAQRCAVFVVHGMGEQSWAETTANLRANLEDALEEIRAWQDRNKCEGYRDEVPLPYALEGYWANYEDPAQTFPEIWQKMTAKEQAFFTRLWSKRTGNALTTVLWFVGQQLRLLLRSLDPRDELPLPARLVYLPLQIVLPFALTVMLLLRPRIVSRVLADVRLYAAPQGLAQRAILKRIDQRVGIAFLQLIGLDANFRPLAPDQQLVVEGAPRVFERVVWVAHSLGTVISYNVLSDLWHRADELTQTGDEAQQEGVKLFRKRLRRFITMGSPLDKFAYLFPDALRSWPARDRTTFLSRGVVPFSSSNTQLAPTIDARKWWINCYNVLDPISGALSSKLICGDDPPLNRHVRLTGAALVPGLAHICYWTNLPVLRLILTRVYGPAFLPDQQPKPQPALRHDLLAFGGYAVWSLILFAPLASLVWWLWPRSP